MIKKNTKAVFENGSYKGEYDWEGGIPLSEGEIIQVNFKDKVLNYVLIEKKVVRNISGANQIVNIIYKFKLK